MQSRKADRVTYARAMGPMQFLPGTWSRYASDGDGDGKADVQNLFDASLAAARYLCSGGLNLRNQSQVMTAILRYNNSMAYARNVLGWAAAYATGVVPVDLPPITGSVPTLAPRRVRARRRPPRPDRGPRPGPAAQRHRPARQRSAVAAAAAWGAPTSASQISTNVPGFVPGQSLGPLPGPAQALRQRRSRWPRRRPRGCLRGCSRRRSRSARCSASRAPSRPPHRAAALAAARAPAARRLPGRRAGGPTASAAGPARRASHRRAHRLLVRCRRRWVPRPDRWAEPNSDRHWPAA